VDFNAKTESSTAESKEASAKSPELKLPEVTVAVDEGGDIPVPDFAGKTMREVTEACLRLGLNPILVGSRLASQQSPAQDRKSAGGAR